jgi:hypothetical protein
MAEALKPVDPNSTIVGGPDSAMNTGQGEEEQREVRLVLSLIEEGKAYRKEFDEDWDKRRDYYHGKQWDAGKKARSKPVMNIIRQMIRATIPILTDQRPGFNPMAREPSDFQFAQCMATLIDNWWDNSTVDHTLIEPIFDSMLYDCGILKTTWNPDLEDSIGDVQVERIDPRDIFVPRGCQDFTKNCGWVVQKSRKTVGELRRLFPDMAHLIKADGSSSTGGGEKKTSESMDLKLVSPTDQYSPPGMQQVGEAADVRRMVDVAECWIDDETVIEEIKENEGGATEKIVRKKYPRGKVITILPNQSLLLQSVEHPYKHGKKPFVRIIDMILPGEFYGEGEAKSLMHTQKIINKTLAHIFDVMQLMANPVWIVEKDAGVDANTITNQISAVLPVNAGKINGVRRDFPPALQSGLVEIYEMLIRQSEQTSGISEISQGRKPAGITAASAIENLQEAAQTRIRDKERNLQASLQQLATQVMGLMMQFYREPRVARITGKTSVWPEYFEFFIEEPEDGKYVFNSKKSVYDEAQGRYVTDPNYTTTAPTKGLVDIKVMSGTAMPWAKTTRANIAFRLLDAGAIDNKELLDTLEWPNAEQVNQRIEEKKAQAGPAGGSPPPGPPPPKP